MRKLLETEGSPVLLKKLFMDRLPSSVRRVLVAGPIDNFDDVARRADRVFAQDRSSTSAPRFVAAPNKLLVEKVDRLAESFDLFLQQCPAPQTVTLQTNSFATPMASTNQNSNFQRPSFSRPRFSSSPYRGPRRGRFSPTPRPPLGDLCFYHLRFGGDAFHCISPCAWRGPVAHRPANTDATLPKKRVAHPGFVVGGLDAIDRKALRTGMLIVRNPKTHIEFMVDSGSRRSVIPCHTNECNWIYVMPKRV